MPKLKSKSKAQEKVEEPKFKAKAEKSKNKSKVETTPTRANIDLEVIQESIIRSLQDQSIKEHDLTKLEKEIEISSLKKSFQD